MQVELPAGQKSKSYCKEDSKLVPQEENNGVGLKQSIYRLKPNRKSVEHTEDQHSPAAPQNLQDLKTA